MAMNLDDGNEADMFALQDAAIAAAVARVCRWRLNALSASVTAKATTASAGSRCRSQEERRGERSGDLVQNEFC